MTTTGPDLRLLQDDLTRPLAPVRAIVRRVRSASTHEHCDMCAAEIEERHHHVVDTQERSLQCLCTHCSLLFSEAGAAQGRYRQVPSRHRRLGPVAVSPGQWERLQVPVSLAFFFTNSSIERTVAFYPGPAGATESLLPLDAWADITATNPELDDAAPDTEAVLVRRHDDRVDCYLVPIDACYALVGRLRMTWVGFDGGMEARATLEAFFADLDDRVDHG